MLDSGALIQEARGAVAYISAALSAAGFDDLPENDPLVLWVIGSGRLPAAEMAAVLGITERESSETVDALVRRGYLAYRDVPAQHGDMPTQRGRPRVVPTMRSAGVIRAVVAGLRTARWADFPFRRGDIVICTVPKTGTTWLQAICAFLVFQSPELPAPMSELSAWLDDLGVPRDEAYTQYAAQGHRRIMKSHLPLNDMPVDPRATYITVGRHPLDAALSLYYGQQTAAAASGKAEHHRGRGPASPREVLLDLFDGRSSGRDYLADMLGHWSAAWARRDDPGMVLVHYEDLSADLEGEMRQISARLGIVVPDSVWPGLVEAATFKRMRASADRFAPAGVPREESAAFFRGGVSGEGRALLADAELARYHARAAQLAPPGLLAWLHRD